MEKFYASEKTISERANLLLEHARELLSSGVLPADRVILRENRIPLISEGYFLLNEFYKNWRISHGHLTERPKIAALQSVVINRLQPFLPVSPSAKLAINELVIDELDIHVIKCNEIFACSYALGILERKFVPNTPEKKDFWLRTLDIVTASSCQSLEPYITDKELQINRSLSDYGGSSGRQVHEDDRPLLNSLVCIYELLSNKGDQLRS